MGGGTSFVGLIIEKRFVFLLKNMVKNIDTIVFVSGTNGKTTTRAIINQILIYNKINPVTNIGGANIVRGIASSLIQNLNVFLKPKSKYAVFEVEEASLPIITKHIKPDYLILTNIFRDQLDVYGEISTTSKYFIAALSNSKPKLIVNQDDPMLKSVIQYAAINQIEIIPVSLSSQYSSTIKWENTNSNPDFVLILEPFLKVSLIKKIKEHYEVSFECQKLTHSLSTVYTQLEGVYNIYNLAFALAFAIDNHISVENINEAIKNFRGVFGRNEKITLGDKIIDLKLIKNPAGCNLILDQINEFEEEDFVLVCLLNDNIADGKDVSWIWDSEFEKLKQNKKISKILVGGSRVYDMALRLDHADLEIEESSCIESIDKLVDLLQFEKSKIVILATYTSMMELRKALSNITKVENFFEGKN
jgi:UDP-N-acetylmuramyl tripeptide synthase